MKRKKEKFIKFKGYNPFKQLSKLFASIKTLHYKILELTEIDLEKSVDRNPYQILFDWCVDVLVLGFICVIPYIAFIGWQGWPRTILILLALGMLPTVIRKFREPIIGD